MGLLSSRRHPGIELLESRHLLSSSVGAVLRAGSIDQTFGVGGGIPASPDSWTVRTDGKILVARQGIVTRLNADGTADTSFGSAGQTTIPLAYPPSPGIDVTAIAMGSDGKIVVDGVIQDTSITNDIWVARLTADGAMDATFNDGQALIIPAFHNDYYANLARQPDGGVVVAGYGTDDNGASLPLGLVRVRADGTLDDSFGSNGLQTISQTASRAPVTASLETVDTQGRILLAIVRRKKDSQDGPVGIMRLHSDGSTDTSFGHNGAMFTQTRGSLVNVTPAADGLLLTSVQKTGGSITLQRLSSDGQAILSFGNRGISHVVFSQGRRVASYDSARALVDSVGRIVIAASESFGGQPSPGTHEFQGNTVHDVVGLIRLTSNGRLDRSFGQGGIVRQSFPVNLVTSAASAAFQPDGDILFNFTTNPVDFGGSGPPETIQRYLSAPQPTFAIIQNQTLSVYGINPADVISIDPIASNNTPTFVPAIRITLNGASRTVYTTGIKNIRIVWPARGVLNHVSVPISGTLEMLIPAKPVR